MSYDPTSELQHRGSVGAPHGVRRQHLLVVGPQSLVHSELDLFKRGYYTEALSGFSIWTSGRALASCWEASRVAVSVTACLQQLCEGPQLHRRQHRAGVDDEFLGSVHRLVEFSSVCCLVEKYKGA